MSSVRKSAEKNTLLLQQQEQRHDANVGEDLGELREASPGPGLLVARGDEVAGGDVEDHARDEGEEVQGIVDGLRKAKSVRYAQFVRA